MNMIYVIAVFLIHNRGNGINRVENRPQSQGGNMRHVHIVLTAGFILELVGGLWTGSLSLVGDSFHMLTDMTSQLVFWLILTIVIMAQSPPRWLARYTWLWAQSEQRLRLIGDMVNTLLLIGAAIYTGVVEAIRKLWMGESVTDPHMGLVVGVIGLLVNLINIVIFQACGVQGMKSVLAHIKSDLGFSLIVIVSLIAVSVNPRLFWLDGLLSLWLSVKMLRWAWALLRDLLQGKCWHFGGIELRVLPPVHDTHDHDHTHDHAH
jgi:cobalt-zinc-cadmium efflux system protein